MSTGRSLHASSKGIGIDLDVLVQQVRELVRPSITRRCGTIQILDMPQPIQLNDIYTSINILETITGRRQLEIPHLLQGCTLENFDDFALSRVSEKSVLGVTAVERYSKLIVLGKPVSGKTTFLKYLAIQCSLGEIFGDRVPIFIPLKDFAEAPGQPSLQKYITQMFELSVAAEVVEQLLSHGRALVLLDGLDEVGVNNESVSRVLEQIRDFSGRGTNQFVLTCRIGALKSNLEQFTEVEIADFDRQQITTFASKWFRLLDSVKGDRFIEKLTQNQPIQQLATNPLLLTLLCLMFEETSAFSNRSDLYKEGLNVLLKKWDAKRNIEREQYQQLSIHYKENLMSKIALMLFERGDYFFRQKEVEQLIQDYLGNLPSDSANIEALQLNSEAVLKSIEVQHGLLVERAQGIYSFSHLTFQEYFTAREIVASSHPQVLETALKQLASRAGEKRWREVFLLSVGMLRNADYLLQLMKQQINNLVAQDEYLQAFLAWVRQQAHVVTTPHSHHWQFSEQQNQVLKQYYDGNKLLVDCLNSDCYVTRSVREEILAYC